VFIRVSGVVIFNLLLLIVNMEKITQILS